MSVRLKYGMRCLAVAAGALSFNCGVVLAQYAGQSVTSPTQAASAPVSAFQAEYRDVRIMPGDVIAIATYGAPELTTTASTIASNILGSGGSSVAGVTIDAKGEIVLPYLGTVKLAGLTPPEAAVYLSNALKEGGFLVDPQVSVELVASPTRVITVLGEVQKPAPIPAFGQIRLLDAISACGGFTPLASHTVTVRRHGDSDPITVQLGVDPKSTNASDIPLMPGDTVVVPKVGNIFVMGEVKTPEAIPLSSNAPITVMRAIAMAGGMNYSAGLSKARIIRTTADNQKVEIMLDLRKVMFGKQQDIALVSDDILYIPMNHFKAALSAGAAGVAATSLNAAAYTSSVVK